ncbi:hypothetical protein NGRA_0954 [Nosema granulosis]|uniref:Uncharacterized protein n=1 Tax=Nosema granulosis TaxID=83296 RepID=A0A9P6H2L1_9MICR|nr:hypothetical protein NGRA_0954 [Nosema granulosis]
MLVCYCVLVFSLIKYNVDFGCLLIHKGIKKESKVLKNITLQILDSESNKDIQIPHFAYDFHSNRNWAYINIHSYNTILETIRCRCLHSLIKFEYIYHKKGVRSKEDSKKKYFMTLKQKINGFSLVPNTERVMIYLIGQTLINSIRGFEGGMRELIYALKQCKPNLDLKYRLFILEYFESEQSLYASMKDFLSSSKIDLLTPESAFISFSKYFFLRNKRYKNVVDIKYLQKENYNAAFRCVRDYSKLCESFQYKRRYLYNTFQDYKYNYTNEVKLVKVYAIKIYTGVNLQKIRCVIELFDFRHKKIGDEKCCIISEYIIYVPFSQDIRYVRVAYKDNSVIIDIKATHLN